MAIKKLRWRFIIINMSLIMIVLIATFSAIIFSTAQKSMNSSYAFLASKVNRDLPNTFIPPNDRHEKDFREQPRLPGDVFEFLIDENGQIILSQGDIPDIYIEDDSGAYELIQEALGQNTDHGLLKNTNVRYMIRNLPDGNTVYAFIDISHESDFIYEQVVSFLMIGFATILIFFFISFYLSKMVIKPVEVAFEKQKRFISDASHELKTPLTVILANLNVMTKKKEKAYTHIPVVENEAKRMKLLIEDLLYLSKVEENKTMIQTEFNFSNLVWESVLSFDSVGFERGLKIDSDIESDVMMLGNESDIKRLIFILLDNACKYAIKDSVISISLKILNGHVVFTINNLSGEIGSDELENIFSRFYRVDKSRNRESGSFGLGLSIAKNIVCAHKGEITVDNSKDSGTTFMVKF